MRHPPAKAAPPVGAEGARKAYRPLRGLVMSGDERVGDLSHLDVLMARCAPKDLERGAARDVLGRHEEALGHTDRMAASDHLVKLRDKDSKLLRRRLLDRAVTRLAHRRRRTDDGFATELG